MLIFHILITYGSKSGGAFRSHPQYKAQMVAFDRLLEKHPEQRSKVIHDYARSVDSLADLPALERMLKELDRRDLGLVLVEDLSRIFRASVIGRRAEVLADLQPYASRLFCMRCGKKLSALSGAEVRNLIVHAEKMRPARVPASPRDTSAAQKASAVARSHRAMKLNQKIRVLRSEMASAGKTVTLHSVAEAANAVGLRTSRGNLWTRQAIMRALEYAVPSE